MQKKIFILTAEPSGDKLASKVISKLKIMNPNIKYLSVGGEHLKSLGIESIYNIKEISYLGFTKVLFNIFSIRKKINEATDKIIKFNPDILFSIDGPDFTLRISKKVKKLNPHIKTIHLVAPQVWVWREHRVKIIKSFIDHILLLFPFEKKYFDKENIQSTFIGHPLLEENTKSKIDLNKIIDKNKRIFSIFPGSRKSEITTLLPILINFVKLMNNKYNDIFFAFHSIPEHNRLIKNYLLNKDLKNCDVIADEKIKSQVLKQSFFALSKSGTVSLEICNAKIPSIIIYKMNIINFFIVKMLIKVRYANIINITANEEIIPELLQSKCNYRNIFNKVDMLINDQKSLNKQVFKFQKIINDFKTDQPSYKAALVLFNHL